MGFAPDSRKLLARWPDGAYAQKPVYPAQCVTPVGEAAQIDPALLARLGYLGTCYGALNPARFLADQSGEPTKRTRS